MRVQSPWIIHVSPDRWGQSNEMIKSECSAIRMTTAVGLICFFTSDALHLQIAVDYKSIRRKHEKRLGTGLTAQKASGETLSE
jgi:hypothetical protein